MDVTWGNTLTITVTITDEETGAPVDPDSVQAEYRGYGGVVVSGVVTRIQAGAYKFKLATYNLESRARQRCDWRMFSPQGDSIEFSAEGTLQVVGNRFQP